MTNKELIELLSTMPEDSDVRIKVKLPFDTMGPTPTKRITGVLNGFDWEHGTILLQSEVDLCPSEYCNRTKKISWKELSYQELSIITRLQQLIPTDVKMETELRSKLRPELLKFLDTLEKPWIF